MARDVARDVRPDVPSNARASAVVHRNAAAVTEAARRLGLDIAIREFPEGTRTAADAAAAIGVEVGQIVKSLVFAVGDPEARTETGRLVMVLVSGRNQLDERKLARAARAGGSWRVDAEAVRAATGFPVGGVPPFGHAAQLETFLDSDLCAYEEVWAAAGTPTHVFAVAPATLIATCGATQCDLAKRTETSA